MERKIILVFSLVIVTACATGASGQSAIDQLGATRPPPASAPHCVTCGARISLTKGCPNCSRSGSQKTKTQPSHSHAGPYMPFHGPGNMYRQPVQPQSDDRLYYDGIETRGGLKTRHFDPDGLAARAEKWGQEMRQVDEQSQKKKDALALSLENDKKNLLEKDGKAIALPQLKNPFADDPNVVDLSKANTPLKPSIPPMKDKDAKPNGEPLYEADLNPLKALSDEQLEKKREALGDAISEIAELQAAVTSEYDDLGSNAQAGKDLAWKAFGDAYATATFGASGALAEKYTLGIKTFAKTAGDSADAISLRDTLEKRKSDPSSVKDGDDFGQVLTVGSGLMKSGIGKVPGAVQSGIDTGLVWANYWKQALDSSRQEELQKQHNSNLMRLSLEQTRVIEEQNRRKRAAVSNEGR